LPLLEYSDRAFTKFSPFPKRKLGALMRLLGFLGLLWLLGTVAVAADGVIRLKTRDFEPPHRSREIPPARHLILRFDSRPDARLLEELGHRRIQVLSFVPDSALMVAAGDEPDLDDLGVTWAGPLDPADKISPALASDRSAVYLVHFHGDVAPERAREIVAQAGLQILDNPGLAPEDVLVTGSRERVLPLAEWDEVSYIQPARIELALRRRVYRCPGPMTVAGPVAEYALAGTGWSRDATGGISLGYFFESLTGKMDPGAVLSEIERAFAEWAAHANVTFSPAPQGAAARSIDILFASGAHGDAYPFTSTAVLAHTFYPDPPNAESIAGDLHFNADEAWADGSGVDLFSVALHEAGHALGLAHSDDPDAVMYPYYRQTTGLSSDDIAAIQALYGSRSNTPTTPPVMPVTPPVVPPVTSVPGGSDTTPPSIVVTFPASTIVSTTSTWLAVSGTASDNVGVTAVIWSTSTGGAGSASGTAHWTAEVPLLVGTNVVTVRAYDAAGNSGWRAITVIRQ
jgi:hypothetical protein